MECSLEVRHDLAAAVLFARGEIDVDSAPDLEAALALLMRSGIEHLTVDFAGVTFIDSSGLYVLARAGRQAKDRIALVVRGADRHVGKVLAMSGLERVVTIAWADDADDSGAHEGIAPDAGRSIPKDGHADIIRMPH